MGIPTDPFYYSDNDCDYFPPGHTPSACFATFTGIMRGNVDPGGDWKPPNGSYKLKQHSVQFCSYLNEKSPPFAQYDVKIPDALCTLTDSDSNGAFSGGSQPAGTTFFENASDAPEFVSYYGGSCQISFLPTDASPSLRTAALAICEVPDRDLLAEFFPVEAGLMTMKLCRKSDKTNISFRFSY